LRVTSSVEDVKLTSGIDGSATVGERKLNPLGTSNPVVEAFNNSSFEGKAARTGSISS
jgi:hypothetical protein